MKLTKKVIGNICGKEVFLLKFENDNNYSVEFYNYGGYFSSVKIPFKNDQSKTEDVLLGYRNLENYIRDKIYLNSIVGRVCNRIANSKFDLNNITYCLYSNADPHHIHGGKKGFNKRVWEIKNIMKEKKFLKCVLFYRSKHMEEGYPGNLDCHATYILNNKNELIINFSAESDEDTIVNITNHNYWNFHGHKSSYQNIEQHFIKINANYFCESDNNSVPTGKLLTVMNKKLDFKKFKEIDNYILANSGIDKCYCINNFDGKIKEVATVFSNLTKMGMIMYTNQLGLQFYTGNMMTDSLVGKNNREYGNQYGLCLEAQFFPDAINHNNFISPILRKGAQYNSSILIKLRNDFSTELF